VAQLFLLRADNEFDNRFLLELLDSRAAPSGAWLPGRPAVNSRSVSRNRFR
jgi:hypothetical protein